MFYKINKTGCQEHKGLCEIRYDLYLDPADEGYSEHYVSVPVYPEGGYPGKVGEMGQPLDPEDYKKWYDTLPTVMQHNPFCCHFCQLEPTVTDEEILFVGELALDMTIKDWATRELGKTKNAPAALLSRANYDIAKSVVSAEKVSIQAAEEKRRGLEPVGELSLDAHIESAIVKIKECEARMSMVHATDFVAFEKTVETSYSIRG
jgi:hypothetical protein